MKTLDEVIEAIGFCKSGNLSKCKGCPYIGTCELDYAVLSDDALYYLKAFRDAKNALDAERERTIDAYCQWKDAKEKLEAQTSQMMWVDNHFQFEISDNPPLDWKTLKTMEGKPVWVVTRTKGGRWGMFDGVWTKDNEDCVMFVYGHRKYAVCKIRLLGKTWQAYRKERSS